MIWNFLKIAYRNLIRQKVHSLVNITGLGLGLACCFLVLLWIVEEFSFDDFHEKADSIYRLVIDVHSPSEHYDLQWVPTAAGPGLVKDIPEILEYARIQPEEHIALDKDNTAIFEDAYYVDSTFLKIFSFPVVDGNPDFVFNDPSSIVLTSSVAKKFFGTDKGIAGKTIRLSGQWSYTIGAVITDVPQNSSLYFGVLLPFAVMEKYAGFSSTDWVTRNTFTYVRLQKNADPVALNKKLKGYYKTKVHTPNFKDEMFLQPLKDVHLFSKYSNEVRLGSIDRTLLVVTMAVVLLIMACINFTNLATAQASRRTTEIGVRKVYGARYSSLVLQFLGESVFVSCIAFITALFFTCLLLPHFNAYTGKELELFIPGNLKLLCAMFLISLLVGVIAGVYPAFYLSRIAPARMLQSASRSVSKNTVVRKVLIVLQFAFSVMLLLCSYTIYSQLTYMRNKDLGYNLDGVVRLTHKWQMHDTVHKMFRKRLTENPWIISAAGSMQNPTKIYWAQKILQWQGKSPEDDNNIPNVSVTPEFMQTMGMDVQLGEALNPNLVSHESGVVVLNPQAVKRMGFSDPCSETIIIDGREFKVIGVLKETHLQPMYHDIMPTVIVSDTVMGGYTLVRLDPQHSKEGILAIQSIWKEYFPEDPLEYVFLDDDFRKIYYLDSQMGRILNLFAIIAVVLTCMGLFAMVTFTTRLRTQEIGIRRVLGASAADLLFLFTREYWILVGSANILAWPAVFFLMKDWLERFSYRLDIPYWTFPGILLISLLVTLLTIMVQIRYITRKNPMETLRHE
ncbi:MAG TPA: ABC transporter permease [Chitinispirillaceae bacterium]|nr:ABC transporter permease [Chitinispirillaceae bacterium]